MELQSNALEELNRDCEILIKKQIEKYLVDYAKGEGKPGQNKEESKDQKITAMEKQALSPYPKAIELKERSPKMLPSPSVTHYSAPTKQVSRLSQRRSFVVDEIKMKRLIDTPIQTAEEKYSSIPRSTVLSRTRQHLSKRNSGAQSSEIKLKTMKTQTESCDRNTVGLTVEPMDFIGMYEKSTNVPIVSKPGATKEQATQMYEHITQSELWCIEWIHKNLFEVKLNPNTLVVDDKIRDASENACLT